MLISFWLTTSVPSAEERGGLRGLAVMYLCDRKHFREKSQGGPTNYVLEEKKIKIYPLMTPFE